MWLAGQVAKMEGSRVGRVEEKEKEKEEVGASRYMRRKLRMEVTIRVEKTKSSLSSPKLGRVIMSPRTAEVTQTNCSIATLNGNWGSAETRDLHPFINAHDEDDDDDE